MGKIKEINLISIGHKIQNSSFELFRFWTKEVGINNDIIIKSENNLVEDLKDVISQAIDALLLKKDLEEKATGWDIGFIIGFIDGNLGKLWFHEYVIKNGEEYKTYTGLRAIEIYLKSNEISKIRIDKLYDDLLKNNSNIDFLDLNINQINLDENNLTISQNSEKGMIITILNNLIMKQIKTVVELTNKVRLPIGDYFTTEELKKLIEDNKKKTGYNKV